MDCPYCGKPVENMRNIALVGMGGGLRAVWHAWCYDNYEPPDPPESNVSSAQECYERAYEAKRRSR